MIPQAYITEWRQQVAWQFNEQVEQDLVICRALLEIYSDEWLAQSLAFRGGTALHKLFLQPQLRYSEDIDLVQIRPEPIKETIQRLQSALDFLGRSSVKPRKDGMQLIFHFHSEFPPVVRLRLKVELNTREHHTVMGHRKMDFSLNASWISETMPASFCTITTYCLEELLATKLRALYQRKKGRDLFDLYIAFAQYPELDHEALLRTYNIYMAASGVKPPSQKEFLMNMEAKMNDHEFLGDTKALLRPGFDYQPAKAYETIKTNLIEKI